MHALFHLIFCSEEIFFDAFYYLMRLESIVRKCPLMGLFDDSGTRLAKGWHAILSLAFMLVLHRY